MRLLLLALLSLVAFDAALADDVYTQPYVRRDGTVVQGHHSTAPNEWRYDNYSARGNANPYTGQAGTQRHEFTVPPAYNTGRQHTDGMYGGSNLGGNPYGQHHPKRNEF